MAKFYLHQLFHYILFVCVAIFCLSEDNREVYIVYMGGVPETSNSLSCHHLNILRRIVDSSFVEKSLVRSYTRSFNGFAANLTSQEHQKLAVNEEVVSIFPNTNYKLHTTRSWDFLGFPQNVKRNIAVESDTIIGVIDTGAWPESESFNDKGFGPLPKKWKGTCNGGANFTCNNKLIGARHYINKLDPTDNSARDIDGHGSHTASTAAGNLVNDASFYGIAKGTARGGVPSARIALYKISCAYFGCDSSTILAALDDAIADGVDIITISIGNPPGPLQEDVIAIGSVHAIQKGILVTQSAGNDGGKGTIGSAMPWIFTVGASTTDRGILTKVVLRNGTSFIGKAVNTYKLVGSHAPVIYGRAASFNCSYSEALACSMGCVEASRVKGKILLCNGGVDAQQQAFLAEAIGVVASNIDMNMKTVASLVALPFATSHLNPGDFNSLVSYFNSTKSSSQGLEILASEVVKNFDAPQVAIFSSRGPNVIIPDILKPDVLAPGVEILAAYSPKGSPSGSGLDKRSVNYNVVSGTSMACPHAAGAAAYVKSFHPDWTPAAIKSAIMTTAKRMISTKDPLAEFSYGAGQIDPVKAVHPGLVYDTPLEDYPKMLCGLGYNSTTLEKIFKTNVTCPTKPVLAKDLNYPTMTSRVTSNAQGNISLTFLEKFTRKVTNVGPAKSTYKAKTSCSTEYKISVKPDVLTFGAVNDTKSFEVSISGKTDKKLVSASLEWTDGVHTVWSPIVIYQSLI